MKVKVLAVVLIVIGVGAMGLAILSPNLGASSTAQYLTATVARGNVLAQSVATGTVAASSFYGMSFGADPQLASGTTASSSSASSAASSGSGGGSGSTSWPVTAVNVKVGDQVAKGQVLATADRSSAQLQVSIARANLAAARARLKVDSGGPQAIVIASAQDAVAQSRLALQATIHSGASTVASNQESVTAAEQSLAQAQAQLATAQQGPTADVIASAQDAVDQAQLSLNTANQSLSDLRTQDAIALSQAAQNVSSAQTQYNDAASKLSTDQGNSADAATIAADQAALDGASAALTAAENAVQSLQAKQAASENSASAQVTQAQLNLKSQQDAYVTKTTPSASALTAAQQAVQNAQLSLESAKQKQASALVTQQDQLAQAQLSLVAAQHGYAQKVAPAAADVLASDQASVDSAQATLTSAEKTLDHAQIVAPFAGTVVSVNVVAGIDAPSGFAIVIQGGGLSVTASFAESDIANIKLGQPATITLAALKTSVDGTVTQITPVGSSSSGTSVVTYNVEVALSDPPQAVLTGMSANVAVTTAQAQDVVEVPAIALVGSSGSYAVRVLDGNNQPQVVPVDVGLVTNSYAEIRSGLNPGETVVTGTVSQRTQTSTTGGFAVGGLGGGFGGGNGGAFRGGNGGGQGQNAAQGGGAPGQ